MSSVELVCARARPARILADFHDTTILDVLQFALQHLITIEFEIAGQTGAVARTEPIFTRPRRHACNPTHRDTSKGTLC
jgi:hypothetical protein